jgi:hypothetical protein
LPASVEGELLVDGVATDGRLGRAEAAAWSDWRGPRLSPKRILGEALVASAAWQTVLACDAIRQGRHPAAQLGVAGPNEQAFAARLVRT